MFSRVNANVEQISNIQPLANYFGKKPDLAKDKFDRNVVSKLSDISFEEDAEDDFEDIKNIKRQPKTVLTEENLRRYLSEETLKIDLEHHHWLSDGFINKIGRMAPNLRVRSVRRLKISDQSFYDIANALKVLERIDISDCPFITERGMIKLI